MSPSRTLVYCIIGLFIKVYYEERSTIRQNDATMRSFIFITECAKNYLEKDEGLFTGTRSNNNEKHHHRVQILFRGIDDDVDLKRGPEIKTNPIYSAVLRAWATGLNNRRNPKGNMPLLSVKHHSGACMCIVHPPDLAPILSSFVQQQQCIPAQQQTESRGEEKKYYRYGGGRLGHWPRRAPPWKEGRCGRER